MSKAPWSKIPAAVWADSRLTLEQIRVLGVLFGFADKELRAWPTRASIADRCGVHPANISTATSALVRLGWLEKMGAGGYSMPAHYQLKVPDICASTVAESATSNRSRIGYGIEKKNRSRIGYQALAESATPPLAESATPPLAESATRKELTIELTNELTKNRPVADTPAKRNLPPVETPVADADASPPPKTRTVLSDEQREACRQTWNAYADAYRQRYGVDPVRNAKTNTQVIAFCKRIAQAESPAVAAHFLGNSSRFYVSGGHQFGQLLADAEKLRTEWATGRTMTSATARQADRTQSNINAVDEAKRLLAARAERTNA